MGRGLKYFPSWAGFGIGLFAYLSCAVAYQMEVWKLTKKANSGRLRFPGPGHPTGKLPVDWAGGPPTGWPAGRLGRWPAGRLGGWAAGRLGGWAAGRLGG